MKILPEPVAFLWDEGNIDKNLKKHKVTVLEAEEMFLRGLFIVTDLAHSTKEEKRYQGLGKTKSSRLLFAAFTVRHGKVRIISIRDMNKREERVYEKL